MDFATGAADRVGCGIAVGVVVGSGRGVAAGVGVGVGSDVGVGDGVGLGVTVGTDAGVGAAVGTGVAVGSGAAEGTGVCFGVGLGVTVGTDAGVGAAVRTGVAVGSGSAVRAGVCVGVGVSAGVTVAVGCGSAAALTVADGAATAVGPTGARGSATGAVCSPLQATNTITADRNSSSTVAAIPALVSLPHNDFMAPFSASVTVESMTRPIYPPDVRFDSAGAGGCAPWERKWQKHPPRGEGLSHSSLDEGVITFVEATFLPSFVSSGQAGRVLSPGLRPAVRRTGCANRHLLSSPRQHRRVGLDATIAAPLGQAQSPPVAVVIANLRSMNTDPAVGVRKLDIPRASPEHTGISPGATGRRG